MYGINVDKVNFVGILILLCKLYLKIISETYYLTFYINAFKFSFKSNAFITIIFKVVLSSINGAWTQLNMKIILQHLAILLMNSIYQLPLWNFKTVLITNNTQILSQCAHSDTCWIKRFYWSRILHVYFVWSLYFSLSTYGTGLFCAPLHAVYRHYGSVVQIITLYLPAVL